MYVAELDGLAGAKAMMDRLELTRDTAFLACVQGLINAIPRTQDQGRWVLPEAGILDRLVGAYLPDIRCLPTSRTRAGVRQVDLFGGQRSDSCLRPTRLSLWP